MADGSQKKWAGWEPRTCHQCGTRITLNATAASHHLLADGQAFSLCPAHIDQYLEVRRSFGLAPHPDQLTLT